jgi:signal transduction histidine kinase
VRERTQALEEQQDKLLRAERLSTLGLLSSAIAHDLRNPLSSMGLAADWLQLRLADLPDDKIHSRVSLVQKEIRRADGIIRTLLGFARTGEPQMKPVQVNALVNEVVGAIDPPESVTVRTELSPEMPTITADRAQLFQVVENLVRNAIQAMPDGGVVCISTHLRPDAWLLCVSDTGAGIPAEVQATIFEPLVSTKSTGTGLGLALAQRIVDAHNGRIWVDSRPGQGASFWIEMPL